MKRATSSSAKENHILAGFAKFMPLKHTPSLNKLAATQSLIPEQRHETTAEIHNR